MLRWSETATVRIDLQEPENGNITQSAKMFAQALSKSMEGQPSQPSQSQEERRPEANIRGSSSPDCRCPTLRGGFPRGSARPAARSLKADDRFQREQVFSLFVGSLSGDRGGLD